MKRLLLAGLIGLIIALPSYAAKYAGEFLEIGIGGRGVAMGGAMTAHTNDPLSFYWNPAGMAYVSGLHVSGMYADLWNGLANYSVVGVTMPITGAVIGAHWVRLGVPDIQRHPNYDLLQFPIVVGQDTAHNVQEYLLLRHAAPQGMFTDNESAVFLTFAKMNSFTLDLGWSYFTIPIELPVGANVKIINQSLGGSGGSGIGADFGFQLRVPLSDLVYEPWKAKLAYGLNWQDATRTAVDWGNNNKDAIPYNLRNGFALIQKVPGRDSQVTASWDFENRWQQTHHFGLEYTYAKVVSLRGGLWGQEWTAGAGLALWRVNVDYAYLSKELGTTHRVSLIFRLK